MSCAKGAAKLPMPAMAASTDKRTGNPKPTKPRGTLRFSVPIGGFVVVDVFRGGFLFTLHKNQETPKPIQTT